MRMLDALAVALLLALAAKPRRAGVAGEGECMRSKAGYLATVNAPKNRGYVDFIRAVEREFGFPADVLVCMAFVESCFMEWPKPSAKGAEGMFQIVPRWHPEMKGKTGDWRASARYAAGYLRELKARFGTWQGAIMAYNWGPTNFARLGAAKAPRETQDYWGFFRDFVGLK